VKWKKNGFLLFVTIIIIISLNAFPALAKQGTPVSEGSTLPPLTLTMPASPEMKQYLGLSQGTDFSLSQLNTRLLLIEVLSALCQDCHKNAPTVNKLFNIIANDPELNADLKMLGIATGNNDKLVEVYAKKYNVKFPIIADPDEKVQELLAGVGTPSIILSDNKGKVLFMHAGIIDDMDMILEIIRTFHSQ